MNPVQKIAEIDRQIDLVTRSMVRLNKINLYSSASWQRAWDKHPEMRARYDELYCQRGQAQHERDRTAKRYRKGN